MTTVTRNFDGDITIVVSSVVWELDVDVCRGMFVVRSRKKRSQMAGENNSRCVLLCQQTKKESHANSNQETRSSIARRLDAQCNLLMIGEMALKPEESNWRYAAQCVLTCDLHGCRCLLCGSDGVDDPLRG